MKYIEIPELSLLADALTHDGPECSVYTRIEAYSCKNIKRDKKLFRDLESAYVDDLSHSPPLPSFLQDRDDLEMTPFGPMNDLHSRKTLYLLIATLNVAFPDYEFSDVRPADFAREQHAAAVLNALSTTLLSPGPSRAPRTYSAYPPTSADFFPSSVPTSSSPRDFVKPSPHAPPPAVAGTHPALYRTLDDVIGLAECEVYSYAPDIECDPHASDLDDGENDAASVGDEDSSGDDDVFDFDDYDVDEAPGKPWRSDDSLGTPPRSFTPVHARMRRRGALLWSSHWFFLNRKMKRILFISVWARTRGVGYGFADRDEIYGSPEKSSGERFLGWAGAEGAGARALGLRAKA